MGYIVNEIAQDDRGGRRPRRDPHRREVGRHVEVSVTSFPVGVVVAGYRLHLHVNGEEVVTPVGASRAERVPTMQNGRYARR